LYNGTLMINSSWSRKRVIEGYADLVAYGKPYIANPDLVERFEHNSSCRSDQDTFYSGQRIYRSKRF
jgi:N-ethylmaleimide reductase